MNNGQFLMISVLIDNPSVEVDWNVTVSSSERLISLPTIVSGISILDNSCNEISFQSFDFSQFTHLKELEIGSNAMNGMNELGLSNLPFLQSFYVGSNSLQHCIGLIINNTPSLLSIEIGDHSFQSSVVFDIDMKENSSSLERLIVGDDCFQGSQSSFDDEFDIDLNGLSSTPLQLDLHSSSSLLELRLGSQSFSSFNQFNINSNNTIY